MLLPQLQLKTQRGLPALPTKEMKCSKTFKAQHLYIGAPISCWVAQRVQVLRLAVMGHEAANALQPQSELLKAHVKPEDHSKPSKSASFQDDLAQNCSKNLVRLRFLGFHPSCGPARTIEGSVPGWVLDPVVLQGVGH